MCGRFSRIQGKDVIMDHFGLNRGKEVIPSYNVSPKSMVAIISQQEPDALSLMSWGLVPWWSKTRQFTYDYINVRSETIFEVKTSAKLVREKRAIIPASGFYEWKKVGNRKIPYYFTLKERELFAFAGIYSIWELEEEPFLTFAIITTEPNSVVAEIHNRMPVILSEKNTKYWLDENISDVEIIDLLSPYPAGEMEKFEVSTKVNNVRNNSPDLISPVKYSSDPSERISYDPEKDQTIERTTLDDFF